MKNKLTISLLAILVIVLGVFAIVMYNKDVVFSDKYEREITKVETISDSDDIDSIEQDLDNTDLDNFDTELTNIQAELN